MKRLKKIAEEYQPRQHWDELMGRIGKDDFYKNVDLMAMILAARREAIERINLLNQIIDKELSKIKLDCVESVIFVPAEDPSIVINLSRDMNGELTMKISLNEMKYGPDILDVKYIDA